MIPNITNNPNIPFTSTYKVSNCNNSKDEFLKFEDLCDNFEGKDNSAVWFEEDISSKDLIWHKMYTLVVDDSKDSEVERYCANHGIKFSRYYKNQLSDIKQIQGRIKAPAGNLKLRKVNADRLFQVMRGQNTSIPEKKSGYKNGPKQRTERMIESGLEIPTSYLSISNNDYRLSNDVALMNILENGLKGLKDNQISIDFIQLTNEPDDNMFYAFYDMGMKDIPLYMNKNTLEYAKALGILTD